MAKSSGFWDYWDNVKVPSILEQNRRWNMGMSQANDFFSEKDHNLILSKFLEANKTEWTLIDLWSEAHSIPEISLRIMNDSDGDGFSNSFNDFFEKLIRGGLIIEIPNPRYLADKNKSTFRIEKDRIKAFLDNGGFLQQSKKQGISTNLPNDKKTRNFDWSGWNAKTSLLERIGLYFLAITGTSIVSILAIFRDFSIGLFHFSIGLFLNHGYIIC